MAIEQFNTDNEAVLIRFLATSKACPADAIFFVIYTNTDTDRVALHMLRATFQVAHIHYV